MAAYSSVPWRKEQGEEREEAHKADMCVPCFLLTFFFVDQPGSVNLCSSPTYVSIFKMGFLLL